MDILVLKAESLKTRYPSLLLAIETCILDNHVNSQKKIFGTLTNLATVPRPASWAFTGSYVSIICTSASILTMCNSTRTYS